MNCFLNQAKHNEEFYKNTHETFADKFFDWKITILFYTGIHYLKALALKRGKNIGETHYEIEQSVNPDRTGSHMKITRGAWREYRSLHQYSKTARYEGLSDIQTFERLKEVDHQHCVKHLDNFKLYIAKQGVSI